MPKDCVIITLACGKFRFNTQEFGAIDGIPRLLDAGQCNDAYSAVVIAQALAQAFNCTISELPLSFVLSWYEQKAVAVLLSLLSLGVKGIRLGPSLPAFVSPNVLSFLVREIRHQAHHHRATGHEGHSGMISARDANYFVRNGIREVLHEGDGQERRVHRVRPVRRHVSRSFCDGRRIQHCKTVTDRVPVEIKDKCREAAANCPVDAIVIEE